MKFNIDDIIRDKATGAVGRIIAIASYISMYRIDCGDRCIWVEENNAEKAEG